MRILFVCTGNTCRSPMAEALLMHKMPEAEVQSAGIFAGENGEANEKAIHVLQKRNISMDHCTQPVTEQSLEWADIVLTMTSGHKRSMLIDFPGALEKVYTLKEYISEADQKVWKEVIRKYADLQEKKLTFNEQHKHIQNQVHLNQLFEEQFGEDINHIRALESNLINHDISDPFGGNEAIYKATLDELDESIDLLIKKIK